MRKVAGFGSYAPNSISTTLTVYFDGHFWVRIAERIDSESSKYVASFSVRSHPTKISINLYYGNGANYISVHP